MALCRIILHSTASHCLLPPLSATITCSAVWKQAKLSTFVLSEIPFLFRWSFWRCIADTPDIVYKVLFVALYTSTSLYTSLFQKRRISCLTEVIEDAFLQIYKEIASFVFWSAQSGRGKKALCIYHDLLWNSPKPCSRYYVAQILRIVPHRGT